MKKLASLALLLPLTSFANFSINFDLGFALTSSNANVPVGSLAVVVIDTANNGFTQGDLLQGFTLGSSLFGADDRVVTLLTASDTGVGAGINYTGALADVTLGTNGITAGDRIGVYFFPGISSTSTILGQGAPVSYGFFQGIGAGTLTPNSSTTNWLVPAADGGFDLSAYTQAVNDAYGNTHNALTDPSSTDLKASLTISAIPVPEPSTYAAIAGLLVLGIAMRRKAKV